MSKNQKEETTSISCGTEQIILSFRISSSGTPAVA
jgi:hypothetical protein